MEKKSVGKNYIYNIIYQALALLVPLITTPYIAKVISVDGIGIYSFSYSIAFFFSIVAELGSITYARREVAFCQDNKEKRSTIFWEIFLFRTVTSIICTIVYLIYILRTDFVVIGLIQMIYIISVIFDITWFFQGVEDFKSVVIRNSVIKILLMIFIFVFVKSEQDLLKYIAGLALLPLIGNLVAWSLLPKYIMKISLKKLNPFKHFKGTFALFIPNIASQVYLLLDKTMLGFMTPDNIENGYYEQAQKIIKMCWTFLTTYAQVMAPRFAFAYIKNDNINMKKYMKNSFNFIWFLALAICFGLISIANNLIPWFLGAEYSKVIPLLYIFSFIVIPIGITSITGTVYLVTAKKQKIYTASIIIGAVFNLGLNLILIPRCFSIGAAISSVLAEILIAIVQLIYVCIKNKYIDIKDVFDSLWQFLIAGISMFGVVSIVSKFLSAQIFNTILLIGIGAIVYILTLLILRNELILDGIGKIKNIINKKIIVKIKE